MTANAAVYLFLPQHAGADQSAACTGLLHRCCGTVVFWQGTYPGLQFPRRISLADLLHPDPLLYPYDLQPDHTAVHCCWDDPGYPEKKTVFVEEFVSLYCATFFPKRLGIMGFWCLPQRSVCLKCSGLPKIEQVLKLREGSHYWPDQEDISSTH